MTLTWAKSELTFRAREQTQAQDDATWEAYATMKRRWAARRKAAGLSRAKAREWLEIAERETA